jgi:hypothetical protein
MYGTLVAAQQRGAQGHRPWPRRFAFRGRFGMLVHGGGRFHHLGRFHRAMSSRCFHLGRRGSGSLLNLFQRGRERGLVVPLVVERVRASADHAEVSANQIRRVFVQRAGVGLLLGHAQLGEQVENALRLYLELSRQLINPDFAHS